MRRRGKKKNTFILATVQKRQCSAHCFSCEVSCTVPYITCEYMMGAQPTAIVPFWEKILLCFCSGLPVGIPASPACRDGHNDLFSRGYYAISECGLCCQDFICQCLFISGRTFLINQFFPKGLRKTTILSQLNKSVFLQIYHSKWNRLTATSMYRL